MVWGTVFTAFPIWAYFMTKYSFYQSSLDSYEAVEKGNIHRVELFKKYIEFKLGLKEGHPYDEEELIQKYAEYNKDIFYRNSKLDYLLEDVTSETYLL